MSARRHISIGVLAAGALLAATGTAVTASSPFVHGGLAPAVVAVSVLVPFAVAAELRARYPDRVLAALLIGVGVAYFVRSLAAIDSSLTYAPARAIGQVSELGLIWLMLAFPSGGVPRPWGRVILVAGALFMLLLWLPIIAVSPQIPARGQFAPCGIHCPANDLLISNQPGLSNTLVILFRVVGAGLLLSTAIILALRLKGATRVMKHILAPVLFASIFRTIAVAAFVGSGSPSFVEGLTFASYVSIPLAIIVGLMQGRSYDAAALQRLVQGLRTRPGPEQLRLVMAQALEDPTLEIAYWLPQADSYADADGLPIALPPGSTGRAVTLVDTEHGTPIAALQHDPALLDHPELLEALSSTAALALETNGLETAVAAARAGTITAVDIERRRIERDLHDGTQQRLIALRMKLNVAGRIGATDSGRADAMYKELVGDIDAALQELRSVSHGIAPPILVERGLRDALSAVAGNAPIRVRVKAEQVGRYPPQIETAVYFCCLEALQNVEKHAGDGASADIDLRCDGITLAFVVRDDGHGFDPVAVRNGGGLGNIRERVEELGGSATIGHRLGGGTEVNGSIPIAV